MNKILKKLIGYKKFKSSIHSGTGFTQGTGFDVEIERTRIFGIEFVTGIVFNTGGEWIRKLRKRIKADEEQEQLEIINKNI